MTEKTAQKEPGKKPVPSKKPKPQQEVVVQIPLSELHVLLPLRGRTNSIHHRSGECNTLRFFYVHFSE